MRRPKAAHFLCPHLPKPPRLAAVGRLVRPLVGCRQLWSVAALPAPQLVLRPSYLAIARQCGSARPEPGKCPTEPESSIFHYVMAMTQDSTRKPFADRWMSNGELQRIASYLDRGRKFEDLLSDDLASELVLAYERWQRVDFDFFSAEHINTDDISAEYALREIDPPFELVRDRIDSLTSSMADTLSASSATQREELHNRMISEIEKLLRQLN
jgi:hypothetical protein